MSDHITVRVAINRVTTSKPGTEYRGGRTETVPGKREDTEVISLVLRVDGTTEADIDKAITKAIRHLESERPEVPSCLEVSADDKVIARLPS